jgi:hypothetical protein
MFGKQKDLSTQRTQRTQRDPDQEKQHTMQQSSVFSVVKSFRPAKWKSNRTGQPCVSPLARLTQVAGVGPEKMKEAVRV